MRFADNVLCGHNRPDLRTFECRWCGPFVVAEQTLEVLEQPMF